MESLKGDGNCYEIAARNVIEGDMDGVILCHGFPTYLRKDENYGKRFGHAWCELNEVVLDFANGNKVVMERSKYYALGNIDPGHVRYFTKRETMKKIVKSGHWGDWRDKNEISNILNESENGRRSN